MVRVRRLRFPSGASDVRALVLMAMASAAFVVAVGFLTWWAASGRDGGRPVWWLVLVGPVALIFFGVILMVNAHGLAVAWGVITIAVMKREGEPIKVAFRTLLRGRMVAQFGAGERVQIAVKYSVTTPRRGRARLHVSITIGTDRNRVIIPQLVRTSATDWQAWAHELCGTDLLPDLDVQRL